MVVESKYWMIFSFNYFNVTPKIKNSKEQIYGDTFRKAKCEKLQRRKSEGETGIPSLKTPSFPRRRRGSRSISFKIG